MKPSDFFFQLTKLYSENQYMYNKSTQQVINRYRNNYNIHEVRQLINYVNKTHKSYKNPIRIKATKQFFTTLQEEAVPETCPPIFQLNKQYRYLKNKNKCFS